ncbi:MAG: uracil-DNA glycosylase family protein [Bacteroidota bacterium]
MESFGEKVVHFHFGLKPKTRLPGGAKWILPFNEKATQKSMHSFFSKFYNDQNSRIFLFGINPGRFGAGVTGVPFTDPIRLEQECKIKNDFHKRAELSSIFVYEVIKALGGANAFFQKYYITSCCPIGFTKDGKNYNYYDDKVLEKSVTPFIKKNIKTQLKFGSHSTVFSMGQGKNYKFLKQLNDKHHFFKEVIPLPHPRWVMQYRLKYKEDYINEYVTKLSMAYR